MTHTALRAQQDRSVSVVNDTLQSIEINPVDVCNRGCSFCPRGHGYTNTNNKLNAETSKAINTSLVDIGFNGHITFAGFGEPLLHKQLERHIETIIEGLSVEWVEVITNGDALTHERALELVLSGVTHITVSMYDADDSNRFEDMMRGLNVTLTLKHLYEDIPNKVNRVEQFKNIPSRSKRRACYLPFYRTFIDYTGDVLLCCNDWSKQAILGNVTQHSLKHIWFGDEATTYRRDLLNKRRVQPPCAGCNVDGIMYGKQSYNLFKEYYDSIENSIIQQASFGK